MMITQYFPLSFRKLLFPFIGLVLGIVLVYSFFNWFFIVRPNYFIKNLVVIETYIPIVISGLVAWYWPIRKLRQLNNQGLKIYGAPRYIVHKIIAFFMLFFVLHYMQIWVETSLATIVELKELDEIKRLPQSRFYKISINSIDKDLMGYYDYEWISYGNNRKAHQSRLIYNSEIYVVYPVFSSPLITKKIKTSYMVGIKF